MTFFCNGEQFNFVNTAEHWLPEYPLTNYLYFYFN